MSVMDIPQLVLNNLVGVDEIEQEVEGYVS